MEIFFIHEYFYKSEFTFEFIKNCQRDLARRYDEIGQPGVNLNDIYYSMTDKAIPQNIQLNNSSYKDIEYLLLEDLEIDSLFPLEVFRDIKYLLASKNCIDSIVPLKKFEHLVHLDLSNNKISNIEPVKNFRHLRYLDLSDNFIHDISPLASLENLWVLILLGNRIDYLSDLNNLKVLQELYVSNNNLKSLSGVIKLKELKKLFLGYNPLPSEELVSIKRHLPNCEVSFEYYPPDEEGLVTFVKIEIFEDMAFMVDQSRLDNGSHYVIYYLESDNNIKSNKQNAIMKRFIDHLESNKSSHSQREIKKRHYWTDTDNMVSCQIDY